MLKNFRLSILGLVIACSVAAQDSAKEVSPATTFSGSLDLYYRYNFANPSNSINNFTSFTNSQNSFELGMATIRADHNWKKAGVTVELGFGRRAQEFSYNEAYTGSVPGNSPTPYFSLANVVQAFVYYNISDRIKLTAGKWGTHIGYEVVDAQLNRNYSMSYMFSYGPFYNMGVKADIAIAGKTAVMIGISNPTDNSTTTSSKKMAIAQISTATSDNAWKFYINYQGGKLNDTTTLNQFDLVLTGTLSGKFGVGFNATDQVRKVSGLADNLNWWGAALYLNWDPSPLFGMTLRSEYFSDKDNVVTPGDFMEYTLTGQIHLGKLTFMPEIRYDNSNSSAFLKHDNLATKNTFTGLLAATYVF